ncbi:Protein DSF2 [Trametes pubescens]|uniref:Protein DSF2 n=1 Tax=Trametes pubescens TaxID=154538 RepID=A0A1M2VVG5_TRAPU|nr:Protein DSF2 [Trametes pubescens]
MSELSVGQQLTPNMHDSSPLGSLIRRTSSRRTPNQRPSNLELPLTPPRSAGNTTPGPPSPLLHTAFRSSTATASSYYDDASMRTFSWDGRSATGTAPPSPSASSTHTFRGASPSQQHREQYGRDHEPQQQRYRDGHDSVRSSDYDIDDITASYRDTWRASGLNAPPPPSASYPQHSEVAPALPTVVVSAEPEQHQRSYAAVGGRVPSQVASGSVNFSRPGLPVEDVEADRKLEVLMRNARSPHSPLNSPGFSSRMGPSSPGGQGSGPVSPGSYFPQQQQQQPLPSPSLSVHTPNGGGNNPRTTSSNSVYSEYSYYEMPTTPTTLSQPPTPGFPPSSTRALSPAPTLQRSPSKQSLTPKAEPANLVDPKTPQDFLQVGIQHHLANRLEESAIAFEKSATLNGGCGVGMLMWGLAQRHGWGCAKSEVAGFRWLRRAAELAVVDLEKGRQGADMGAVKSELVLAIYEVGQSFYRGWGVEKDKEMAVQYFRVAARLGDPDAQQELAFCLLNGKGCKKDKRESAKWYRAAVAQGVSDIGLAWIYKDKYQ